MTELLTGKTVRTIATPALLEFETSRLAGVDSSRLGELKKHVRHTMRSGEREEYPAVAGQISGMVRDILPVAEIMEGILAEAASLAAQLGRLASESGRSGR